METLVVMDYCIGRVDIYNISNDTDVSEELLNKLGYNIDEISWMVSENVNINVHNKIIK